MLVASDTSRICNVSNPLIGSAGGLAAGWLPRRPKHRRQDRRRYVGYPLQSGKSSGHGIVGQTIIDYRLPRPARPQVWQNTNADCLPHATCYSPQLSAQILRAGGEAP